ncbi:MAG: Mur ligase family protein [Candidatus Magasanikbacteria bacterium]
MKRFIKIITPDFIINTWHYFNAWYGSVRYNHPSEEMLIIGVTGTSGKSSTIHFLRQLLEYVGYDVGSLSTADFYIKGESKLNDRKMTMLGKGQIHKYLRKMKNKDCDIAIIETTSEGALQHRHKFINYDFAIFTNLYPEHLEAHGGFENYKECKLNILRYISSCRDKFWNKEKDKIEIQERPKKEQQPEKIPKTCVLNANNEHMQDAIKIDFDKKCVFARSDKQNYLKNNKEVDYEIISSEENMDKNGLSFKIDGETYSTSIMGKYNIWNILAAISVVKQIQPNLTLKEAVADLEPPPGRLEFISEAEAEGFKVLVDYAFEPKALKSMYETIEVIDTNKIIHVCGSAGGGRDKSRRGPIGNIAAENADIVIATNEDPYYEDPMEIINQVAKGAEVNDQISQENIYKIMSREEAIEKAVSLAEKGDLVIITGKGCEQGIMQNGEMIDWDDREVVREKIRQL